MQTTLNNINSYDPDFPNVSEDAYWAVRRLKVNTFEGISEMSSFIKGRNLGSDGDNLAGNSRAALQAVGNLCSVNRSVVDEG